MLRIYVIFLFISLVVTSCQPEPLIVDDVPAADRKLVVSTVVGSEELLSLLLTTSYGALEGDLEQNSELINNYILRDAEVFVRYGNQEVQLGQSVPGVYGTNNIDLVPGEEYELDVFHPTSNQSISSKAIMQGSARFDQVSVEIVNSIDTAMRVQYSFQDLPGESYYMVNVQKVSERQLDPQRILRNRVYTHLVNDKSIPDGGELSGEFIALFRYLSFGDTLLLSLSNISYEYYDYLDRVNNGFLGPSLINEPYNFPSNIENGYGFFNLYLRDTRLRYLVE